MTVLKSMSTEVCAMEANQKHKCKKLHQEENQKDYYQLSYGHCLYVLEIGIPEALLLLESW